MLPQDWEGIVEVRTRAWEVEVQRRRWQAHIPRHRSMWRRWAGAWLMGVGGWLTHLGAGMVEEMAQEIAP